MKPLNRGNLFNENNIFPVSDKWALGTQKKCVSPERLAKKQQFKEYFWDSIGSNRSNENLRYISTDHITPKIPKFNSNNSDIIKFTKMKGIVL